jgi:predicted dehydrogenase
VRIGIVGTENSHAKHHVRHFNQEGRFPGYRVVALAGGDTADNRALSAAGGIDRVVGAASELIGLVDAAVVCFRDGRRHRAAAVPLLAAGLPVLVDKPFAGDLNDARRILAAAHHAAVPVASYSAMRWIAVRSSRAAQLLAGGEPDVLTITGPADATSEHAGLMFYGIHLVEIALGLLPGRPARLVAVEDLDDAVVAIARAGRTRLLLEFAKPATRTIVPYRIATDGPAGASAEVLRLDHDYVLPGIETFVEMLRSGRAPLPDTELLASVELMSDIAARVGTPDGGPQ